MKRSSEGSSSSKKLEKNVIEKARRNDFNQLCSDLASNIPPRHLQPSTDVLSQADQIEEATKYIVELRERVDDLNKRKHQLETTQNSTLDEATTSVRLPTIEVKEFGCNFEVRLVMESENDITSHQVIKILEEEGAEIFNAVFAHSGDKVHYTLHAKAKIARVGVDVSRVSTRLHELI